MTVTPFPGIQDILLLQCKAEEMEFMFTFESSFAERLWRCSILLCHCIPLYSYSLPCYLSGEQLPAEKSDDGLDMKVKGTERLSKSFFSHVLLLSGLGELAISKQTFAPFCTIAAAQMSLHNRRVVPKFSFECLVISWIYSNDGIDVYSARPRKLYCTFLFLSQTNLEDCGHQFVQEELIPRQNIHEIVFDNAMNPLDNI